MNRPFFIVGAERSGTTMLRLMLNEHPDVLVPPETSFLIDLMNRFPLTAPLTPDQTDQAFEIITAHERWKDLGISDRTLRASLRTLREARLSEVIHALFLQLLVRSNKVRWGDKTPEYVVEIDRLHHVFPDAQFVHLIRDARDVSRSLLAKRWRGTHIANAARYWSEHVHRGLSAGRKLPESLYLEVHYEDLVRSTEATLRRICTFLALPYTNGLTHFHKSAVQHIPARQMSHHMKTLRPPQLEDVERWKHEATAFEVIAVEALAGATMEEVGQQRRFSGVMQVVPETFRVLESAAWRAMGVRRRLLRRLQATTPIRDESVRPARDEARVQNVRAPRYDLEMK